MIEELILANIDDENRLRAGMKIRVGTANVDGILDALQLGVVEELHAAETPEFSDEKRHRVIKR